MIFCPQCGTPATPETHFCPKCGATISVAGPPPAPPPGPYRAPTKIEVPPPVEGYSYQPPQQPPGAAYPPYAPQSPPPPPAPQGGMYPPPVSSGYAPPKRRSKAPWIIVGVVVLLAATAGVLFATHVIRWPFGSGPKDAVEQAREAYNKKDAVKFEKYVDLKSLISDVFDQTAADNGMDQPTLAQVKFAMPQIVDVIKNVLFGTPTTAPAELVQPMTAGAEQIRTGLQKLTYQGIDGDPQITGKEAIVRVKLTDISQGAAQPRILELKLKDNGTNWQVVAALNLKKFDPTFGANQASSGPKEAVEQARAAYTKKDAALFDKYVDLESVVSDVFDQMAAEKAIDQEALTAVKANLPKIAEVVKSIFFGTPTDAPPELVQSMTASSQQLRTALENVTYQGVDSVSKLSASDALVKVKLSETDAGITKTKIMEVKVKDAGPNWKVVSVPNLSQMDKQ